MFAQVADTTATAKADAEAVKSKVAYVGETGGNWFVSLSGGVQAYHGDHNKMAKFAQRATPYGEIAVGKWVKPWIGVRVACDGFNAKGATAGVHTDGTSLNGKPEAPHWLKNQEFPYVNGHVDLMIDILNLFAKYNPIRNFGLQGTAGPGYAYTWDDPSKGVLSVNSSISARYSLTKALDVNLGVHGMIVDDSFEGETGGNNWIGRHYDGVGAVTVGVVWNFTKKGWKEVTK